MSWYVLVLVLASLSHAVEETVATAVKEEPLLGALDIVLIVALLAFAGWWLLNRRDDSSSKPVYTIQWVLLVLFNHFFIKTNPWVYGLIIYQYCKFLEQLGTIVLQTDFNYIMVIWDSLVLTKQLIRISKDYPKSRYYDTFSAGIQYGTKSR